MQFTFSAIGIIHSCFKEKFGIPRQPGLAPLARARLELLPPYNDLAAFDGLEGSSHIWVQFVFHGNHQHEWRAKVRPPRLGGNQALGVFATRSPQRPNPIGLSVVRLEGIQREEGKLWLELSGIDLLDGTPVLDIKPYLPYVDSVPDAHNAFAPKAPALMPVEFSTSTRDICGQYLHDHSMNLRDLIVQVLQQDPRPPYQTPGPERIYGMKLLDLNVRWIYTQAEETYCIQVIEITGAPDTLANNIGTRNI